MANQRVANIAKFVLRRFFWLAQTVFLVLTFTFLLIKLIPGDPAQMAAGRFASSEQVKLMRQALHLDLPLVGQYFEFIKDVAHGQLGTSATTHRPVLTDLGSRLPITFQLVLLAIGFVLLIGIPAGMTAAYHRGNTIDRSIRIALALCGGMPIFWLAIVLQWWLGHKLHALPISGSLSYGNSLTVVTGAPLVDAILSGRPVAFVDAFAHAVLPAFCLSLPFIAVLARTVRSGMIDALSSDYSLFSVAFGVSPLAVARHALHASISPILTLIGMQCGWMMSAALLVEGIYGLPGMGEYLTAAVRNQDVFAVLGCVLAIGITFACASLAVEILQLWLDPRLRDAAKI